MDDAIAAAKRGPEFKFGTTAKIEMRPIEMTVEIAGFVYTQGIRNSQNLTRSPGFCVRIPQAKLLPGERHVLAIKIPQLILALVWK